MKPLGAPATFPGVDPLIAHQGGWDEILMVLGPLAVVGGLLWLANKRVAAQLEGSRSDEGQSSGAERAGRAGKR